MTVMLEGYLSSSDHSRSAGGAEGTQQHSLFVGFGVYVGECLEYTMGDHFIIEAEVRLDEQVHIYTAPLNLQENGRSQKAGNTAFGRVSQP